MKIERRGMQFDHLLSYQTVLTRDKWQEGIFIMEELAVGEGIYQNGPFFFSVKNNEDESNNGTFTYFMPINGPVAIEENSDFCFRERFALEDALVMRQADQLLDFYEAETKLRTYAAEQNISLEATTYVVLLEVYNEIMIDLYIPIQNQGNSLC
ncbi:hypothetical protein SAMN04488134_12012 [Amphibacillus marinus]|uniref:DUF5085 domain-containing protein n=1 Tax=Amphibacillus marinus TaxID=872970 RepID=A0A1H8TUV3_9BACI|nr:hypothetical protein [Amphibacillus marinus]SEO94651.1 hypothetical protein SAMN04488134_12012 [Amphibacillus marinus]